MCRAPAGCTKLRDAALDPLHSAVRGSSRAKPSGAPPLDSMLGEGLSPRPAKPAARAKGPSSAAIAAHRLGGGRAAAGRRRAEPGLAARLAARLPRVRPFKLLTVSAFSIALVGIVANAMIFQRGHHPAPLFGLGRSIDGQPEAAQPSVAERSTTVAPPATPAPLDRAALAPPPPAPPAVVDPAPRLPAAPVAPKPNLVHHAAPKPHQVDAIGGLLSAATVTQPHPRPGVVTPKPGTATKPAIKLDHKAKSADGGAAAVQPDPAHHVSATQASHPRPHAKPVAGKAALDVKQSAAKQAKTE